MKKFFIKKEYVPNNKLETIDNISKQKYWNTKKITYSKSYQYYVYKYALNIIIKKKLKSLIDVGCGVGTKLEFIHKKIPTLLITGIDQESAINYCKKKYPFGKWIVDNFENPNNKIKADLIICSDVIEHLLNPNNLLNYLKKSIKNEGYIIISTPERDKLRGKKCNISPNKYHIREWNYREIENYLKNSGFEIIEHKIQLPIKFNFNKLFFKQLKYSLINFLPLFNNQVLLLKKKN
jgi:2-polyprenyl-3-methyl-5-hydroxy-6-metoxy-1,4-benzoquinol methylase